MKKYSEKGWNWLVDNYPREPGRYWFEGFNPIEGYPNRPDLTRKDIRVLAEVDDITHPLYATSVDNGEPLYNLFFFATLAGADNLVRFKRFDEEADLRRVGIKMCAKSIDEFTKGFRMFANVTRQQELFDLGVDLLTNPELIKRPDFRYSKIAYDAMRQIDGSSGAFCMGYLTAKHLSKSFPPAAIPTLAETLAELDPVMEDEE